jgi:hypothetical protein
MRAAIALIGFMLVVGSAIAANSDIGVNEQSSISATATWGIAAD